MFVFYLFIIYLIPFSWCQITSFCYNPTADEHCLLRHKDLEDIHKRHIIFK